VWRRTAIPEEKPAWRSGLPERRRRLKAVGELDDDTAAALSSLEVEEGDVTTRKVKFFDKNAALEKAIKHLGL
jgi:hypothetical protein